MYKFYRVPKEYSDMKEVMVRYCLDNHKDLNNVTHISIQTICLMCGYPLRSNFKKEVKVILKKLVAEGLIIPTENCNIDKRYWNEYLEFQLSDQFFPCKDFVLLTSEAFNVIANYKGKIQKIRLLQCYLHMRSHIYFNNKGLPYGFSQPIDIMSKQLHIAHSSLDKILQIFVENNLFIKYITGSVKTDKGIKNVPNIYVLPDDKAESNIKTIEQKLKQHYHVTEFMPIVGTNKKIKKKRGERIEIQSTP